jgi:hypothetical protein
MSSNGTSVGQDEDSLYTSVVDVIDLEAGVVIGSYAANMAFGGFLGGGRLFHRGVGRSGRWECEVWELTVDAANEQHKR